MVTSVKIKVIDLIEFQHFPWNLQPLLLPVQPRWVRQDGAIVFYSKLPGSTWLQDSTSFHS